VNTETVNTYEAYERFTGAMDVLHRGIREQIQAIAEGHGLSVEIDESWSADAAVPTSRFTLTWYQEGLLG
jgi:hypothetical protein